MYNIGFNCDDNWNEQLHGGIGEKYYDYNYKFINVETHFILLLKKDKIFPK